MCVSGAGRGMPGWPIHGASFASDDAAVVHHDTAVPGNGAAVGIHDAASRGVGEVNTWCEAAARWETQLLLSAWRAGDIDPAARQLALDVSMSASMPRGTR